MLDVRNHHLKYVLALNSLNNVISVPTRRTPNSDTLLDHVAVSDSIGVLEAGTTDVCNSISDHSATYIHALLLTILETHTNVLFGFITKVISIS